MASANTAPFHGGRVRYPNFAGFDWIKFQFVPCTMPICALPVERSEYREKSSGLSLMITFFTCPGSRIGFCAIWAALRLFPQYSGFWESFTYAISETFVNM